MNWGCTLPEPQGRTSEGVLSDEAVAPADPAIVTAELAAVLKHARRIAELAVDKLAEEIVILDMTGVTSFTDYFVICSGRNARQTKGIFDEILHVMKREARLIPRAIAGEREAEWIVMDYGDIVVHIFAPELRSYYRLEDLWGDVPRVALDATAAG